MSQGRPECAPNVVKHQQMLECHSKLQKFQFWRTSAKPRQHGGSRLISWRTKQKGSRRQREDHSLYRDQINSSTKSSLWVRCHRRHWPFAEGALLFEASMEARSACLNAPYVHDQLNVILTLFRGIFTFLQPGTRYLSVSSAASPPIKARSPSSEALMG